jgi:hypothetical protein
VKYSFNQLIGLRHSASVRDDVVSNSFYRVIQIQLCVIYAYTGFEKLKGNTWWDGTALWSVFANPQMVIWDMTWMSHFPLVIVFITFTTVLFEIYFPVLIWFEKTKRAFLYFGMVFHFGIGLLMSLFSFAFVMLAPYFLFLNSAELDRIESWFHRFQRITKVR